MLCFLVFTHSTRYTSSVSHLVQHTKAVVLSLRNVKEANKIAVLYTRDFGLIYVSAQSIRMNHAKMRYHLQYLSLVEVDLVRGREFWKLVGIHEILPSLSFVTTDWYSFLDKLATILYRLNQGEESNQILWNEIDYLFFYLKDHSYENLFEFVVMVRVLSSLGYWQGDEIIVYSLSPYDDTEVLDYVQQHRLTLVTKINTSLRQTQL